MTDVLAHALTTRLCFPTVSNIIVEQCNPWPCRQSPWPCPVSERLAKQKFSHWGFPVNSNEAEIFLLSCLANRSLSGQHPYLHKPAVVIVMSFATELATPTVTDERT